MKHYKSRLKEFEKKGVIIQFFDDNNRKIYGEKGTFTLHGDVTLMTALRKTREVLKEHKIEKMKYFVVYNFLEDEKGKKVQKELYFDYI